MRTNAQIQILINVMNRDMEDWRFATKCVFEIVTEAKGEWNDNVEGPTNWWSWLRVTSLCPVPHCSAVLGGWVNDLKHIIPSRIGFYNQGVITEPEGLENYFIVNTYWNENGI